MKMLTIELIEVKEVDKDEIKIKIVIDNEGKYHLQIPGKMEGCVEDKKALRKKVNDTIDIFFDSNGILFDSNTQGGG